MDACLPMPVLDVAHIRGCGYPRERIGIKDGCFEPLRLRRRGRSVGCRGEKKGLDLDAAERQRKQNNSLSMHQSHSHSLPDRNIKLILST